MVCSRQVKEVGVDEGADLDSSKINIPKSARLAIIDWFNVAGYVRGALAHAAADFYAQRRCKAAV